MSAEENKAIVRRWIEELTNRHNLAINDELVADGVVAHNPMGEWHGRESYRQMCEVSLRGAPDLHCTIEEIVAEADTVAFRFTATFTHAGEFLGVAPTGRQLVERGMTLVQLSKGKIVEFWDQPDVFGLLQQLGAVPEAQAQPVAAEQVVNAWGDAWNSHDVERVLATYAADAVHEDVALGEVCRGHEEIRRFAETIVAAFPDCYFDYAPPVIAGARVTQQWTVTGTHQGDFPGIPATGKPFSVRGVSIIELAGDKVRRVQDYSDTATMLRQLGLLPEATPA